jgi:hypothetical protein
VPGFAIEIEEFPNTSRRKGNNGKGREEGNPKSL